MQPSFPSLKSAKLISIDCETKDEQLKTHGPGYHRDGAIAGVAIAVDGFSEYYPVAHEGGGNLDKAKVYAWLREQLRGDQPKLFAHAAYDLGFLNSAAIKVNGPIYDVQIAEPLLNESRRSYSLETLSQHYLKRGKKKNELNEWIGQKFGKTGQRTPGNFIWRAPGSIVRDYAIEDTQLPLEIFPIQKRALEAENLWDLFLLESRLIPMLVAMRMRGVQIDLAAAERLYETMTKKQKQLGKKIGDTGPETFVWLTAPVAALFDKEGIEYPRTPKTNRPSFTKEWLAACQHPIGKLVQEIRHLDRMRNTFVKGVVLEGHHKGRLHASFNQLRSDATGTVSGRFSSSQPNLQQIPVRTELSKPIRSLFLPDKGQDFGTTDFSQIEFRLLALAAAEQGLRSGNKFMEAYNKDRNTDFHQVVADMTGLPRNYAKTITFAAAYGAGPAKIAMQLGMDEAKGMKLLNEYHRRAPFIKPLSGIYQDQAEEHGEITTLLGRKRRFNKWQVKGVVDKQGIPILFDKRVANSQRAFTYRALNAYIQGSAADVLKQAMVLLWEGGVCDVLGAPHLTVHDELDVSVPKNKVGREAFKEMVHTMETAVDLAIPLLVDHGLGKNWGEAKG